MTTITKKSNTLKANINLFLNAKRDMMYTELIDLFRKAFTEDKYGVFVVTGFSNSLYKNINNLDNYNQENAMINFIEKYRPLIK